MINRENLIKIGRAGGNTSNRETPDQIGRVGMSVLSQWYILSQGQYSLLGSAQEAILEI